MIFGDIESIVKFYLSFIFILLNPSERAYVEIGKSEEVGNELSNDFR